MTSFIINMVLLCATLASSAIAGYLLNSPYENRARECAAWIIITLLLSSMLAGYFWFTHDLL